MPTSSSALTLTAYPGDGAVLLGFSLDPAELKTHDLVGFSIECTPPAGKPFFLENRLNFANPVTSSTTSAQTPWTSSENAPFQKFHWVHFPANVLPGNFHYEVTARYCQGSNMADGPKATVAVELAPPAGGNFELGLTRAYISSQAYASKFGNKPIRPLPKSLDYNTQPFQPQYEWLGYHARKMIFDLLGECLADPSITVDLFAYDLDEPDIVDKLEALGTRLRAVLDNAPLHLGAALEVIAHTRLVKSAGAGNIIQGHFKRFAHDKIIIAKKNGKAVKVLTGSANFSVRGLYVQANNVLLFSDPKVADQYEQVFQSVFTNMPKFSSSPLASKWFDFPNEGGGVPDFSVSFAPHKVASVSLAQVQQALNNAKSSVMFAIMELQGGGTVLKTVENLHTNGKVFSYGMTQSVKGFTVYKPGQPGVLVPFAALIKNVPPPFNQEFTGGPGQVIHDKFIVIDFNDKNPVVFTGSSNLAEGGEQSNGDNLLAIRDARVAEVFAVEAIRLVDHYQFRAAAQAATQVHPLMLSPCGSPKKWWARDYDSNDMYNVQRELFALGPSAITKMLNKVASKPVRDSSSGTPARGRGGAAKGSRVKKKNSRRRRRKPSR
ncbi:MAG: phospholipase D-like domain-containing protein [Candidatus Acidiferrales bacterium]